MFCLAQGTQRRLGFFLPCKMTRYCTQKQKARQSERKSGTFWAHLKQTNEIKLPHEEMEQETF